MIKKESYKSNTSTLIILLLVVSLIKEIVFSILVPIWHTPDEQAHFAQVAYIAEMGKLPSSGFDLNKEIYTSEVLLGTDRDSRGDNKFTFHPEYKITFSNSTLGQVENQINNLPKNYRTEFVKQEAANYPPLYYEISALVYNIFNNFGLIGRIFAVRFFSIILNLLLVYMTYLIAKQIFGYRSIYSITLPILVAFQPMVSFVSSGVNSDNLFNLLFSIIIYLSVLYLNKGFSKQWGIAFILTFILAYLTKPQFVLAIPIVITALVLRIFSNQKVSIKIKGFLTFGLIGLLVFGIFIISNPFFLYFLKPFPFLGSFFPGFARENITFLDFFKQTLRHTEAEVIPWYWGVFDWLGVVLPRWVNRVLNYLMVLAGVGFLINVVLIFKSKTKEGIQIIFLALCALIYFLGITYYNYLFTLAHTFPFGIQGRYYFPTIVPEMVIILVGLATLIPFKYKEYGIKLIAILMIVLNFLALGVIAQTYYSLTNINTFINQVSQYKPVIFKGEMVYFWTILYLIFLIIFICCYLSNSFGLNFEYGVINRLLKAKSRK